MKLHSFQGFVCELVLHQFTHLNIHFWIYQPHKVFFLSFVLFMFDLFSHFWFSLFFTSFTFVLSLQVLPLFYCVAVMYFINLLVLQDCSWFNSVLSFWFSPLKPIQFLLTLFLQWLVSWGTTLLWSTIFSWSYCPLISCAYTIQKYVYIWLDW